MFIHDKSYLYNTFILICRKYMVEIAIYISGTSNKRQPILINYTYTLLQVICFHFEDIDTKTEGCEIRWYPVIDHRLKIWHKLVEIALAYADCLSF